MNIILLMKIFIMNKNDCSWMKFINDDVHHNVANDVINDVGGCHP
jgi:hypothetical protein